ncbi:OTU domain-containing protein [Haematococcus lacustris]|uniref:OTU domain-containing protein n=1 Tax=Haematococcus lacustris TaxID=44745 RepID=A0A699Z4U5_HAELA|nr:OTU domain-containing protein [Haematococcus lacustris]
MSHSKFQGPSLTWTASRRALEVLVVKEEHFSRTDKGLGQLSHHQRLSQRLQRLNLDMLTMAGDGNCQVGFQGGASCAGCCQVLEFRTISFELFATQDMHLHVRRVVMEHIK